MQLLPAVLFIGVVYLVKIPDKFQTFLCVCIYIHIHAYVHTCVYVKLEKMLYS